MFSGAELSQLLIPLKFGACPVTSATSMGAPGDVRSSAKAVVFRLATPSARAIATR
jgi:hypothetical protein